MTQLGELSLWIALLMAAWCPTLAVQGALMRRASLVESGARGLQAALLFTLLAAAGLAVAFLGDDFSLRYVAVHSSQNVLALYKLGAVWSGGGGQLLAIALGVAAAGSFAARLALRRDADKTRAAWTVAVIGLVLAVVLLATVFEANPFTLLVRAQEDGRGLEPFFRNPLIVIQPPLLMLGISGASVTIAIAISATIGRRVHTLPMAAMRVSALASWGLLSAALLLGARWAYASPDLRQASRGSPVVLTGEIAWAVATLFLTVVEVRNATSAPLSEADILRRRAGRVLAIGGALLCVAFAAAGPRTKNYDAQIDDGGQFRAKDSWGHDWVFTSQGASRMEREGYDVIALALLPTRDGVRQPFIASESRQYYGAGGLDIYPAQTVPAIRSMLAQDLFVVLSDAGDGRAVLRISFKPLVGLGWAGGVLLAVGALLLLWPPRAAYGQ